MIEKIKRLKKDEENGVADPNPVGFRSFVCPPLPPPPQARHCSVLKIAVKSEGQQMKQCSIK
jgi:hypothetical protein